MLRHLSHTPQTQFMLIRPHEMAAQRSERVVESLHLDKAPVEPPVGVAATPCI
jgi:hypothetical protein